MLTMRTHDCSTKQQCQMSPYCLESQEQPHGKSKFMLGALMTKLIGSLSEFKHPKTSHTENTHKQTG
jgi:hypothetical protein